MDSLSASLDHVALVAEESMSDCADCTNWREECNRLTAERDRLRENADFLRKSVGECHLMISRQESAFQLKSDWEATDLPRRVQKIMQENVALKAAVEQARPEVEKILALANGLSNRLKGTPDMYEANKIMHAAWAIQDALTASAPSMGEVSGAVSPDHPPDLSAPTSAPGEAAGSASADARRQIASVLTVHYGAVHACAVENLLQIVRET